VNPVIADTNAQGIQLLILDKREAPNLTACDPRRRLKVALFQGVTWGLNRATQPRRLMVRLADGSWKRLPYVALS